VRSFFLPPESSTRLGSALLFLRVIAGAGLIFHGWGKIQTPFSWMGEGAWAPPFLQALAAFSEVFGGFALIVGLLAPLAALGVACTMIGAVAQHMAKGQPFVGRGGSWELASLYLAIALLILLNGPGKFALDTLLRQRFVRDRQ